MRYLLDEHDRLKSIDPDWCPGGDSDPLSTSDPAIGRSLWDFITSTEVRHLYEIVFARVRETRTGVCLPFRCDAPDSRVYMNLEIRPLIGRELEVRSLLVREEPRPPVALLGAETPRSDEFVVLCSWCKRIRCDDGSWAEIEEAAARTDLFAGKMLPKISHAICASCDAEVRRRLAARPNPNLDR